MSPMKKALITIHFFFLISKEGDNGKKIALLILHSVGRIIWSNLHYFKTPVLIWATSIKKIEATLDTCIVLYVKEIPTPASLLIKKTYFQF